jgi:hypothetical protein
MSVTARPDYGDAMRAIETLRASGDPRVQVLEIGRSARNRSIPAAIFSDPASPDSDKQHVLVIAGTHGNEESGRAIALELMSFLLSPDPQAEQVRKRMRVAVVPCVNPDGAEANTYRNADGADIFHGFRRDTAPATPEGAAVEAFAWSFVPDVFVDVHGMAGGGMKDKVWLVPPLPFGADAYYLTEIAGRMMAAAEAEGLPQSEVAPPGPFRGHEEHLHCFGDKLTTAFKTLCLGMESIEFYYREPQWRRDGITRLRALFAVGLADTFGLGEPGYPNVLVSGNRIGGLKAHGRTAEARRRNRIELADFLRQNYAIVDRGYDGLLGHARMCVSSQSLHGRNPDRFALLLRLVKPCEIRSITWDGTPLTPDDTHGYRVWEDANSLLLQANLVAPFGGPERHLDVHYSSPYLPQP